MSHDADPPICWHFNAGFDAFTESNGPLPAWVAAGVARIVKRSPQRTVYRVELPGEAFYVKQHHIPDRRTWLRQCIRPAKGRTEFERLVALAKRGIAAPEPLGWGTRSGGESFLVTRALDHVTPLVDSLMSFGERSADRQRLACELGRFLAKLHDAGVLHRDLHPGNFLLRHHDGRFEFTLVDLDAVRLGATVSETKSVGNLALFAAGFLHAVTRVDRYRFLAAYAEARGWIDHTRDRAGPRTLHDLARRVERAATEYQRAFARHRDERCLASNRYFVRIDTDGCTGHALRTLDSRWLDDFLRDPDAVFAQSGVRLLKDSPSSTVAATEIPVAGELRPVIVKRFLVTRSSDPWTALVRPTGAMRSWVFGPGRQAPGGPDRGGPGGPGSGPRKGWAGGGRPSPG
jgi:tRNA A-37 threonylcarbamoyl transferase component Bud32